MDALKTKINQISENQTFRIFLIMLIVWVVGSFSIILFESGNIDTVGNAIWWTIVTITTVGYGDIVPITIGGKIFTSFISFIGIGVVSIPTALLASSLTGLIQIDKDDLE